MINIERMGEFAALIITSPKIGENEERLQTNLQYWIVAKDTTRWIDHIINELSIKLF